LTKNGGRKPLNLVLLIDISGSMSSSLDSGDAFEKDSKLRAAKDIIITGLLPHLTPYDNLAIVLFDTDCYVLQDMTSMCTLDLSKLKSDISIVETKGGTKLGVGFNGATEQIQKYVKLHPEALKNESRIFFLTDAIPNSHEGDQLLEKANQNVKENIYTTFIGLGIDFNIDLVDRLGKVKAHNYFAVKSVQSFRKVMDLEFDYVVSPDVFNVDISYKAEESGFECERVFGSPGFETPSKGSILQLSSSMPSQKKDLVFTKGGVILIKLRKVSNNNGVLKFCVTYDDRDGKKYIDERLFEFPKATGEFFEGSAVRKAVLLTRFVNFMKNYIVDVKEKRDTPTVNSKNGIILPPLNYINAHETAKMPQLNPAFSDSFDRFIAYFNSEADKLGDHELLKELDILHKIKKDSVSIEAQSLNKKKEKVLEDLLPST